MVTRQATVDIRGHLWHAGPVKRGPRSTMLAAVSALAVPFLATCGEQASNCPGGTVRHVGQGLVMLVPDGSSAPYTGMTADVGPVHAEAGVVFEVDGVEVQAWRVPAPPADSGAGVSMRQIDEGWLFLRGGDPALRTCLLATLTYDPALDLRDE